MMTSVPSPTWPTNRRLTSIRVKNTVLLPHSDSAASIFVIVDVKFAIIIVKTVSVLMEEQRENSLFHDIVLVVVVVATEHEDVLGTRVTMKIAEEENVSFLLGEADDFFECTDFWCLIILCGLSPASVEI